MEVRNIPQPEGGRVESGPTQFGDDWPGVFIRGDSAFNYVINLETMLRGDNHPFIKSQLKGLRNLLAGCIMGDVGDRLRAEESKSSP